MRGVLSTCLFSGLSLAVKYPDAPTPQKFHWPALKTMKGQISSPRMNHEKKTNKVYMLIKSIKLIIYILNSFLIYRLFL